MTKDEIKQIERVFKKPISQVDKLDIPAYIRKRDKNKNSMSKDYPLGGTIEPYDIMREQELLDDLDEDIANTERLQEKLFGGPPNF